MTNTMSNSHSFNPSGARFHVTYRLRGSKSTARSKAQNICFEQTVEADEHSVPAGAIREHLVGRVEDFAAYSAESYRTTISYPCELLTGDFISLLNVIYGIASLNQGVRVLRLEFPDSFLTQWRGARFGCEGLRSLLNVASRPLVCGVLKPLGLSPTAWPISSSIRAGRH
jgi:ribulose-bisphosphate carboxylase large chain